MNITIYHNPGCSKSRKTLEILREHGIEPRIVEYLRTAPDAAAILRLARLLKRPVLDLVRKGDADYADAAGTLPAEDDEALAEWLSRHPRALQRSVVVDEARAAAVIGRPPENVLELLRND